MNTYAVRLSVTTYGSPASNTRNVDAENASQAIDKALSEFGMNLTDTESVWATRVDNRVHRA